jgi:outer membrane protein assembly factor BamB
LTKKRLLIGSALLLILAGGALAALWAVDQATPDTFQGSPTDEFVATDEPAVQEPPRRVTAPPPPPPPPTDTEPDEDEPEQPAPRRPLPLLSGTEWWPTYGYDNARTHVAPAYGHRPPYRQEWRMRAGHLLEFPPSVAYGRVYLAQQRGRFFALNAETGRIIWQKKFGRCAAASPTVANGIVYQAYMGAVPCPRQPRSQRGFVIAMNARNGVELWRFEAGAIESTPLYHEGTLYFGSWDHHLYAVDARTGKLRWRFRADHEINSAPAFAGGMLFFGTDGGSVYAVNARSGRQRWRARSFAPFGRREYFYATPAIAYGRVYVGNTDGILYAFGAGTGRLLWAQRAGTYVYTAPTIWRRTVYVGSYDGYLTAFDAATGARRWRHGAPAAIHGAPTVLSGLVYFSTCGTCGQRGQRYARAGPSHTFAVDARNGRRVWQFPDGQYSPIVADGKRVYLTGRTSLYGLVPRSAPAAPAPAPASEPEPEPERSWPGLRAPER